MRTLIVIGCVAAAAAWGATDHPDGPHGTAGMDQCQILHDLGADEEAVHTLARELSRREECIRVHAENLENSATPGYRRVATHDRPATRLFIQGPLVFTEREMDWAIDGEGFYRVTLPDQTVAYTRLSTFSRDSEGNVVTPEGYLLDPAVQVPRTIIAVTVDSTGQVFGMDPSQPGSPTQLGTVTLTRFTNPSGLEQTAEGFYLETPSAGSPVDGQPGVTSGFGCIRQCFIEQSNVDWTRESVDLTIDQRAREDLQRLIDRMLSPRD